jgi:CarD family transcriptional regulator
MMFKVGDSIIYSAYGVCQNDEICDKTVQGVTRTYYVLPHFLLLQPI